jgi:D-alanine-D-alanine ligase
MDLRVAVIYNLVEHFRDDRESTAQNEPYETALAVVEELRALGHCPEALRVSSDFSRINSFDLAFNLAEGIGDDGAEHLVPQMLKIPYTGSTTEVIKLCNDKLGTKRRLRSKGLRVPGFWEEGEEVVFPVIVKPVNEHGSIGIDEGSIVYDKIALKTAIDKIHRLYGERAICEEYVDGREISAAIVGNENNARVLALSEIIFRAPCRILSYDAKWSENSESYAKTEPRCPAILTEDLEQVVKSEALRAYNALGMRDYGRIDFRVRGEPYIIDANPNPCISPKDSGFARALRAAGIEYRDFVAMLLSFAQDHSQ